MAIARRDDWLTDAQGRALDGAVVYYCNQPATTSTVPPSPLATIYSNLTGTPEANPQLTDGFGHAVAYADSNFFYTIVYVHPLFGPNPVVLIDQSFGGGGSGGAGFTPFSATPAGVIDGTNAVFTIALPNNPVQVDVWLNFPLINGLGFVTTFATGTLTITYAVAPRPGGSLYAQGWY